MFSTGENAYVVPEITCVLCSKYSEKSGKSCGQRGHFAGSFINHHILCPICFKAALSESPLPKHARLLVSGLIQVLGLKGLMIPTSLSAANEYPNQQRTYCT